MYGIYGDLIKIHPKPYFMYLRVTIGFWAAVWKSQLSQECGVPLELNFSSLRMLKTLSQP